MSALIWHRFGQEATPSRSGPAPAIHPTLTLTIFYKSAVVELSGGVEVLAVLCAGERTNSKRPRADLW